MSIPHPPPPAKLVVGIFLKDRGLVDSAAAALLERLGPLDIVSPWLPFDYTTYYESEMGSPLFRRVLVFNTLVAQDALSDIKLFTNELEMTYARDGGRMVNIDPGLLTRERFVLATGKNFTHRIYIGKGIFADLTLVYQKGAFRTLPWTYPDYAGENMLSWLEMVRGKYVADLKAVYK